jgi:hypothetical protein
LEHDYLTALIDSLEEPANRHGIPTTAWTTRDPVTRPSP